MLDNAKLVYDKIKQYDTIIIHRHRNPDHDAIGSQMGLKQFIETNFVNKRVLASGDDGYAEFSYIGEINFPYKKDYDGALVIIVDTANRLRVDGPLFVNGAETIKIDHHPDIKEEQYGDLNVVDIQYSSTCELLYYLFKAMHTFDNDLELNPTIAKSLFCGIYGDTGGFVYPNTTSKTFTCLSELVSHDFDYENTVLNMRVYDLEIMQVVAWCYQNLIIKDGVGYVILNKETQKLFKKDASELSFIVSFLGSIKDLKVWAVFNEHNNFIRVNLRSRQPYDVSSVAMQYKGGGHKNASGAMIKSFNELDEVVNKLIELVE
ncbi:MAG: bifunctional oligoribonuclease/PAP phosphatase NrnA [Spiroplasma sp.]|nr:bifunctional oligoribonuclease/PAP phosphatase NrnA [Mycoplasmatales bacterium]